MLRGGFKTAAATHTPDSTTVPELTVESAPWQHPVAHCDPRNPGQSPGSSFGSSSIFSKTSSCFFASKKFWKANTFPTQLRSNSVWQRCFELYRKKPMQTVSNNCTPDVKNVLLLIANTLKASKAILLISPVSLFYGKIHRTFWTHLVVTCFLLKFVNIILISY